MVSAWFEGVPFGYFVRAAVARLGVVRTARRRAANDVPVAVCQAARIVDGQLVAELVLTR